ncbi:MAG: hypothetical protein AB7S36_15295, partial [Planctomycetota bacterium]
IPVTFAIVVASSLSVMFGREREPVVPGEPGVQAPGSPGSASPDTLSRSRLSSGHADSGAD